MSLADTPPDPALKRLGRFLSDNPVIPLIAFLFLLIAVLEVMRPGIVMPVRAGRDGLISTYWVGNLIKFAIPLAMLAACQVLTMLTAGIDLSVGIIATVAAFVCATLTTQFGVAPAVLAALACGLVIGLVNGFGVGIVRVHPLIMTLGTGLIASWALEASNSFSWTTSVTESNCLASS